MLKNIFKMLSVIIFFIGVNMTFGAEDYKQALNEDSIIEKYADELPDEH